MTSPHPFAPWKKKPNYIFQKKQKNYPLYIMYHQTNLIYEAVVNFWLFNSIFGLLFSLNLNKTVTARHLQFAKINLPQNFDAIPPDIYKLTFYFSKFNLCRDRRFPVWMLHCYRLDCLYVGAQLNRQTPRCVNRMWRVKVTFARIADDLFVFLEVTF